MPNLVIFLLYGTVYECVLFSGFVVQELLYSKIGICSSLTFDIFVVSIVQCFPNICQMKALFIHEQKLELFINILVYKKV